MAASKFLLYLFIISLFKGGKLQNNPCPNIFQYVNDGSEIIGGLRLSHLQSTWINVKVQLSIGTRLSSSYIGALKPTTTDLDQEYQNTGAVIFKIYFPATNPLPLLTSVSLNGRVICSGPPAVASFVSSVSLEYSFSLNPNSLYIKSPNYNPYQTAFQQNNGYNYRPNNFQNGNYQSNSDYFQSNYVYNKPNDFESTNEKLQQSSSKPTNFQNNQFENGYSNLHDLFNEDFEEQPTSHSPQNSNNYDTSTDDSTRPNNNENESDANDDDGDQAERPVQKPKPTVQTSNLNKRRWISRICGSKGKTTSLIVNGQVTKRGDYPWHAAIYKIKDEGLYFICGGNLISDQHVLTAAHCLNVFDRKIKYSIFLGKQKLHKYNEAGAQVRENEGNNGNWRNGLLVHEDYVPDFPEADIGIIKLEEPVRFNNFIHPICLYDNSLREDITGEIGTVVGWGRDGKGNVVSNELQEVQIKVVDSEVCRKSDKRYENLVNDKTICAEGVKRGSSPCDGDSGGGVAIQIKNRWFLRGIVSTSLKFNATYPHCNPEKYFVLVDTFKYYNWIRDHVFYENN